MSKLEGRLQINFKDDFFEDLVACCTMHVFYVVLSSSTPQKLILSSLRGFTPLAHLFVEDGLSEMSHISSKMLDNIQPHS